MISDNQNGVYLNVYEVRVVRIPEYKQKSLIWKIQTNGTLNVVAISAMYEYCNNKNMIKDVTDIANNWIGMNGWL